MPVALPTPDELARMDWYQRERAVRTARHLLRAYGGALTADLPKPPRPLSAEAQRSGDAVWGEQVRAEARRLAGEGA